MFKNVASQKIAVFAFTITTGAAKTGDSANITAYVSKDYGTVTVLGDTSATEMDATNAPGWYLFDLTQAETNADALLFTGKSVTANISIVGQLIYTVPPNFTAASIDSSGRLDVIKVAGTTQTAGDITGKTNSLTFTVANQVDSNVIDWKGATAPAMTGDAFARLGAPVGASTSADVAAVKALLPTALVGGKMESNIGSVTAGVIAAASFAASALDAVWSTATRLLTAGTNIVLSKGTGVTGFNDLDAAGVRTATGLASANLDTQLSAINTKTTNLPASPADETLIIAATNAIMARLGAPAGASMSADTAAVKSDTGSIKTKTDSLTFTVALKVDANPTALNGDATAAANLAKATRSNGRGTVATGGSTTSIPTSAFAPSGVATDQFKGRIITFDADTTTAALRGQATDITGNTGAAAPVFAVTALTTAPASGDTFSVT